MNVNQIHIKRVTLLGIEELHIIAKKTFFETYSKENSKENMENYLEEKFNKKQLEKELKDSNSEFYFAIMNNKIAGYLKLNFKEAQTEINNDGAAEIERIYVLQEYQGNKIGKTLYNKSVSCAKEKEATYIWLGVWERNENAIGFYKKQGFLEFDKHVFVLGDEKQTDIMMKVSLD